MAQPQLFQFEFIAMGCTCQLQLFADQREQANLCAQRVIDDVYQLERRYSRYREDSFLSQINRVAAGGGSIQVDEQTAGLLDYAQTCYDLSDGLFDVSAGLLRQVWRFDRAELPVSEAVESLLLRIGWSKIGWRSPWLSFDVPGMELDFGGIVKEYAADRAVQICRGAGIVSGVVNLGGDLNVIGPRPDGRCWNVGLGATNASIGLNAGAVASSGDYERCFEVDGVRYSHILNPRTGYPVRYLSAVSVVADLCVVAGSASTIAMLKEHDGPQWLAEMGLPHLWVDTQGNQGGSLMQEELG